MKTQNHPRMHVSLYVSDIERTVNFYDTFFGTAAQKVKTDYAKYILEAPALIISFVQNKKKINPHFGHLGFEVGSEAELALKLQEAKSNQLEMVEEMGTNCCYAKQDKFWVADPDGHQWEVYYFHSDSEFNDPKYDTKKEAAACCEPGTCC